METWLLCRALVILYLRAIRECRINIQGQNGSLKAKGPPIPPTSSCDDKPSPLLLLHLPHLCSQHRGLESQTPRVTAWQLFFLISLGHIRAVLKRINEIQSRIERFNICCYNGAEQCWGDGPLSVTAPHGTAEQLSTQVATWQIRCEDFRVEVTQERHQDCGCSGWLC